MGTCTNVQTTEKFRKVTLRYLGQWYLLYIKITGQGWIQHSLVEGGGGGARSTLVPNVIGYSAMHSELRVLHLSLVFDNCGNLMILLLTTKITVSHTLLLLIFITLS